MDAHLIKVIGYGTLGGLVALVLVRLLFGAS